MTGEEINRALCHSFDKDGNTVPPSKTYKTLTPEEKIAYLEWRDDVLCDEFNEEMREFDALIYPLRPHNDKKRFPRDGRELGCPTFYDGCNCKPDHTQEDWNDLKEKIEQLTKEGKMSVEDEMALNSLRKITSEFPNLRECDFLWLLERIRAEMAAKFDLEKVKPTFPPNRFTGVEG
jgi:hypothetical protein